MAVLDSLLVALLFLYFLGTAVHLRRAFWALRKKPYIQMRMAHLILRLQVRAREPDS